MYAGCTLSHWMRRSQLDDRPIVRITFHLLGLAHLHTQNNQGVTYFPKSGLYIQHVLLLLRLALRMPYKRRCWRGVNFGHRQFPDKIAHVQSTNTNLYVCIRYIYIFILYYKNILYFYLDRQYLIHQ